MFHRRMMVMKKAEKMAVSMVQKLAGMMARRWVEHWDMQRVYEKGWLQVDSMEL